ncbi:N-acetyltransferase domain containing 1 [Columba livia]|uniref:N-acetyltransferase domain containing 1 n=1 Tax=Columba livia TaxID=8932 RepID=A0A2I0M0T3_COLLI|nr:N-acetyltransferase domain containing 1 [Columba livia]
MLLQAPGCFPAAEEEGSPHLPRLQLFTCLCHRSQGLSRHHILRAMRIRPPGPGPSPGFGAGAVCLCLDADGFSVRPLERSPGWGHHPSACWPPRSSEPRALAASWGPHQQQGEPPHLVPLPLWVMTP